MINAISAADIEFIMSSSTSAWLLSPLEFSPQKQNGWMLRFCFWGWIMWKMYNKTIIEFGFRMISWIIKTSLLCYLPQPSASADNTDLGFDNSRYHAQPHPIIVYYNIDRTLRALWLVKTPCFIRVYNIDKALRALWLAEKPMFYQSTKHRKSVFYCFARERLVRHCTLSVHYLFFEADSFSNIQV